MLTLSACTIAVYMLSLFILALYKKDNSIVDVAWGGGFILLTIVGLITTPSYTAQQIVLTLLTFIWGTRLALRIYLRNKGKGEDIRYAQWRKKWGKQVVIKSFFFVFTLQGIVLFIIALPITTSFLKAVAPLSILNYFGVIVWLVGFTFEAIGDYQLDTFLSKPENKGRILQTGLWRYTRHPNYFGEAVVWWGIWLIAYTSPYDLITLISPITITLLLRYVSGVPLTESLFAGNQEYEAYKKTTAVFIPCLNTQSKG